MAIQPSSDVGTKTKSRKRYYSASLGGTSPHTASAIVNFVDADNHLVIARRVQVSMGSPIPSGGTVTLTYRAPGLTAFNSLANNTFDFSGSPIVKGKTFEVYCNAVKLSATGESPENSFTCDFNIVIEE